MPSFSRPSLTLLPGVSDVAAVPTTPQPSDAPAWSGSVAAQEWGAAGADDEWRLDALCAETDPEAFFPDKGGSTRDAKRVCAGCPVRAECLEYALAGDERFGIWGGLSERERRRVRLQRRTSVSA